jgi:hypothetical protein
MCPPAAFKFSSSHDVTEVTKAGYDACSGANPVKSYTGGSATVKLSAPGKRYFICSIPGHCAAGTGVGATLLLWRGLVVLAGAGAVTAAAATVTSSFMPAAQWPGMLQMK